MAGYKWLEIPSIYSNIVKDKKQSANAYYRYFLARLSRMFEYKNLPDTIPHEMLDRYLMNNGIACITKVNGSLYCFYGNLGGPQDVYYRPTEFIISNPHIKTENGDLFTANVPINPSYDPCNSCGGATEPRSQEGVLMRNDTEWIGLAPMLSRYSYLLAENILTLRTADVMLRITALLTAPSDKERIAAEEYIKSLEKGELKVIGESPFFDGVKLQSPPSNNGSYLTQFIEYQQYLKGSIFNELGLVANYNMKREAIGKGESTLDTDAIIPLADNMLLCRQEDLKRVNDLYGTDISVSFSSAWLQNLIETEATLVALTQQQTPFGASASFGGEGTSLNDANGAEQDDMGQSGAEQDDMGQSGAEQDTDMVDNEDTEDNEDKEAMIDNEEQTEQSTKDSSGSEGEDETGESESEEDSKESEINDTASEGILEEIMEKVEEGLDQKETVALPQQEGVVDNVGETESSDDKEDVPSS